MTSFMCLSTTNVQQRVAFILNSSPTYTEVTSDFYTDKKHGCSHKEVLIVRSIFLQVDLLREVLEPLTLEVFKTALNKMLWRILKRAIL